ncbi:hypothetical protein H9P43_008989 [Blastocladiella emersonii ATCC 22665]|nr:hypothetical protein H9P43_008989 [Blastocladiella emersonii ATCC 22665]
MKVHEAVCFGTDAERAAAKAMRGATKSGGSVTPLAPPPAAAARASVAGPLARPAPARARPSSVTGPGAAAGASHAARGHDAPAHVLVADQLVNAVALQIRLAFTAADTAPVMRLCKHLLHTLLQFFDAPLLACSVSLDTLGQLMTELLTRLLDADLPNRSSGVQLVKALNMLMVRILDKSPANQIFAVLLRMLGDALPVLQTGEQVKYAELTMKCLWKVIRMLPTYLKEDGKVNVAELLRDIHFFLEHIQAADWRRRETPLGDVPIRTIKTMLSELSLAYGDAILDHFHLVDDKDDAYVFTYTKNLLASQARKRAAAAGGTMGSASSLPGSQYGSAASLTGGSRSGSVADASEAHQQHQYQQQHYGAGAGAGLGSPAMQRPGSAMSHRSYASSAAFAAAAASAGSGTETVMAALAAREATAAGDKEAFDELTAIFSKLGCPVANINT